MQNQVYMSTNFFPKKPFNWKKWLIIIVFLSFFYFVLFYPFLLGEILGAWFKMLSAGFKSKL